MPIIYDLSNQIQWEKLNKPIFADTNVISVLFYDRSSSIPNQANLQNLSPYLSAISDMFSNGKQLHLSSIVLLELINVFLKWDKAIYNYGKAKGQRIDNPKSFREIPTEKQARKQRYALIFNQISSANTIQLHGMNISLLDTIKYVNTLDTHSLDTNDYIITSFVTSHNGILLTDDHDFACTSTGCDIITNNQRLIAEAVQAGFSLA